MGGSLSSSRSEDEDSKRETPTVPTDDGESSESPPESPSPTDRVQRPAYPLTAARFAFEKAVRRAMRKEAALYEANELKLNGITREIDDERRRFFNPNRSPHLRMRDEIYAINAMMRDRERQRFEEYAAHTQMSEAQAQALRLNEDDEMAAPAVSDLADAPGAAGGRDAPLLAAGGIADGGSHRSGGSGRSSSSSSSWRLTAADRWFAASQSVAQLFREVAHALEGPKPPSEEELAEQEAAAQKALAEAQRQATVDAALEACLQVTMEAALDEAMGEVAASDVGAELVLSANGIGTQQELAPSEVYARAMDRAQREFDRATRAYHRSEHVRLRQHREQARIQTQLKRKRSDRFKSLVEAAVSADGGGGQDCGGVPLRLAALLAPTLAVAKPSKPGGQGRRGSSCSSLTVRCMTHL